MLADSKKKTSYKICDNACEHCNGHGKIDMVPKSKLDAPFETNCIECLGNGVITEDIRIRKNLGKTLKVMLHERDLTIREGASRFSQSFMEWINATQGNLSAEEIQKKITLLDTVPIPKKIGLPNRLKAFPQ